MVSILTDIVLTVTGFQLLLLAAVLLTRATALRLQRGLLAAFLLSKAFLILRWFVIRFGILDYGRFWQLHIIAAAGFFLLAPLLLLYVQSLCRRGFALQRRHLAHAAPFAFVVLAATASVLILGAADEAHPSDLASLLQSHFWDGFWLLNLLQILTYLLAMVLAARAYRRGLAETYSSVAAFDLRWLLALLAVAGLHWCFVAARAVLSLLNITAPGLLGLLDLFSITIFLVFTTALVVKGVGQLKVIPGFNGPARGALQRMSAGRLKAYAERLDHLIATERPYLEPALTVDQLAARMGLPTHELSQVINGTYRENFFNFVNRHRVAAAQARLQDPAQNHKTMLQILHEAGFNSKTSFNDAFKRYTKMTPSAYRRQIQSAPAP